MVRRPIRDRLSSRDRRFVSSGGSDDSVEETFTGVEHDRSEIDFSRLDELKNAIEQDSTFAGDENHLYNAYLLNKPASSVMFSDFGREEWEAIEDHTWDVLTDLFFVEVIEAEGWRPIPFPLEKVEDIDLNGIDKENRQMLHHEKYVYVSRFKNVADALYKYNKKSQRNASDIEGILHGYGGVNTAGFVKDNQPNLFK